VVDEDVKPHYADVLRHGGREAAIAKMQDSFNRGGNFRKNRADADNEWRARDNKTEEPNNHNADLASLEQFGYNHYNPNRKSCMTSPSVHCRELSDTAVAGVAKLTNKVDDSSKEKMTDILNGNRRAVVEFSSLAVKIPMRVVFGDPIRPSLCLQVRVWTTPSKRFLR